MTTGREPSKGAMGAMNRRSRRSTARASCPSAPVPRAAWVPPYARRRKANLTWLSSWRTSAPEAMCRCWHLPVGGDDRVQLAFNVGELDECAGAERGEQVRQLRLARSATGKPSPRPLCHARSRAWRSRSD